MEAIRKIKKIALSHKKYTLAVVVVIFVAAIFIWQYAAAQKREVVCLRRIEYRVSYYRIGEKRFKTQDEAMNYCLKVIRPTGELSFASKIRPTTN